MTNPNDPAFAVDAKQWVLTKQQWEKYPGLAVDLQSVVDRSQGLTKREYFAILLMATFVESDFFDLSAKAACRAADALIAELSK